MNYLWEVALRSDDCEIPRENLRYIPAKSCSPYMEVSFVDLNTQVPDEREIEANPLYRFAAVFGTLFDINLTACPKTRAVLFDICMQYIIQIDLRQGLTKSEYYLRYILKDILNGVYGVEAAQAISLFTPKERRSILTCMLTLYRCSVSVTLFRKVMRALYPESIVYVNNDLFREILIYIGIKETVDERKKIDFILSVFLQVNYTTHLFWEHHFGIIDVEETMLLDDMVLF